MILHNQRRVYGLYASLLNTTALGTGPSDIFAAYDLNGVSPVIAAIFSDEVYIGPSITTFDDLLTHTASGLSTMIDSADGLLKWRPHNFLSQSQNSSLAWITPASGVAAAIRTANAGTDPDGGSTATKLEFPAVSGSQYSVVQQSQVASFGPERSGGVWLKAFSATDVGKRICVYGQAQSAQQNHTLTSDWALVELTGIPASASPSFNISVLGGSTSGGINQDAVTVLAWGAHAYRSDLGGMSNNPATGDSYVPTTAAAVYLPRRNAQITVGSTDYTGTLIEPTAATQLLHTTDALVTQSHTVTAVAHTLHFTGTGTITLSGASTAGPLVGTGTGEDNRVSLTFTPTAGTLTLTISGTVTNAQLETGSVPSSYIPNTAGSGTITRAAETLEIASLDAGTYDVRVIVEGTTTDLDGVVHAGGAYWPTEAAGLVEQVLVYPEGTF